MKGRHPSSGAPLFARALRTLEWGSKLASLPSKWLATETLRQAWAWFVPAKAQPHTAPVGILAAGFGRPESETLPRRVAPQKLRSSALGP